MNASSHAKPTAIFPLVVAVACVGLLVSSLNGIDVVAHALRPGLNTMQFGPTTGTELADFIESTETTSPLLNRRELIRFGRSVGDDPVLPALRAKYMRENPAASQS